MNWSVSPKKNPAIVEAMKGYPNWLNIQRNEEDGTPKDRGLWMLKWAPPEYPKPDEDMINSIISSLKWPSVMGSALVYGWSPPRPTPRARSLPWM